VRRREGSLRTNASASLKLPVPPDRRAEHRLFDGQLQELLGAARPSRDHTLLRLLYVAGLTVGEAVALNWGDLEARGQRGRLHVVRRGRMRVLWLPDDMWTELLALGRRQSDAPVFASTTGRRLRRGSVNALLARTALRAGLSVRVSPQTLRHAYAWRALERGASLAELMSTSATPCDRLPLSTCVLAQGRLELSRPRLAAEPRVESGSPRRFGQDASARRWVPAGSGCGRRE
jgi:integrase/recombinase XerD